MLDESRLGLRRLNAELELLQGARVTAPARGLISFYAVDGLEVPLDDALTPSSPIEVGNLFVFGFSRFARYLIGGDLLFDGGMVLTY